MSKKNSLAKNTLLLSIGTFLTKGISFIMVPLFSRWLTISDYGTFDLLCTYVSLLVPMIGLASNEAIFRFSIEKEKASEKAVYVTNGLFIFAFNSLIAFIAVAICYFVFDWKLAFYFYLLLLGEVYNIYLRGFLRGIKQLGIFAKGNVIITACNAVAATVFIKVFNLGLEGMILGNAIGYIVGDIIIVAISGYVKYFNVKLFSLAEIKHMIKYSYALIPNSLAWWVINVSDRTIIKVLLGTAANGIYAVAYKIPNICSSVFSTFGVSWQQAATEMLDANERNAYYNKVYNKMLVILLSINCGVLSVNAWLFRYIFDLKYIDSHLYAPILVTGTLFSSIALFYGGIQISFKMPKENGITTVIGAVVNIAVHLACIKFIGLYAACVSTLLSQVVVCGLRRFKLKNEVSIKFDKLSMAMIVIYIYFFASSYIIYNDIFNVINFVIAGVIFLYVNRDYANKILAKVRKK